MIVTTNTTQPTYSLTMTKYIAQAQAKVVEARAELAALKSEYHSLGPQLADAADRMDADALLALQRRRDELSGRICDAKLKLVRTEIAQAEFLAELARWQVEKEDAEYQYLLAEVHAVERVKNEVSARLKDAQNEVSAHQSTIARLREQLRALVAVPA